MTIDQDKRRSTPGEIELLEMLRVIFFNLIAITFGLFIYKSIIHQGYSLDVNLLFFSWIGSFILMMLLLDTVILFYNSEKTGKRSISIFFDIGVLCLLLSILLFLNCQDEPEKGILAIQVHGNSTNIPGKVSIKRNFPGFLSSLDKEIELDYDEKNRTFYTSKPIRCGKWTLVPWPADDYGPVESALIVPSKKPYKGIDKIEFHKRLCDVDFKTSSKDGKEIVGARIKFVSGKLPFGFKPEETTPCNMKLEIGTYQIVFELNGYNDSQLIEKTFFPNEPIIVEGILSVSRDQNPIKKIKPKKSKPSGKIEPTKTYPPENPGENDQALEGKVKNIKRMELVKDFIHEGNLNAAEKLLNEIVNEAGDAEKAEAENLLEKIRELKKEH